MPPFAIIVTIVTILIVLLSKSRKDTYLRLLILYCFLDIGWFQGVFLKGLESSNLSCARVIGLVFTAYSVYFFATSRARMPGHVFLSGFAFLVLALAGTIYGILIPWNGQVVPDGLWDTYIAGKVSLVTLEINLMDSLKSYTKVALFVANACIFKALCTKEDVVRILRSLLMLACIVVSYGVLEYVLKNVLNLAWETYAFLDFFFGGQDTAQASPVHMRGDAYGLYGFTRETAHFVTVMYLYGGAWLLYEKIRKTWAARGMEIAPVPRLLPAGILFCILLSGGGSGMVAPLVLAMIYYALRKDLYRVTLPKLLLFAAFIAAFVYLGMNLLEWLSEDPDSYIGSRYLLSKNVLEVMMAGQFVMPEGTFDSTLPRFLSIIEVFRNTLDRPLLGMGFEAQSCHDTTVQMFSDCGLLGMIAWWKFATSGRDMRQRTDFVFVLLYIFVMGLPLGTGNPMHQFYLIVWIEATRLYCNSQLAPQTNPDMPPDGRNEEKGGLAECMEARSH